MGGIAKMSNRRTLIAQQFGRLTVLSQRPSNKSGKRVWLCSCSCGGQTEVTTGDLQSGDTRSCGCLFRETVRASHLTHGQTANGTRSEEYEVWAQMRQRCANPASRHYANYGGRGIYVCAQWESFATFFADMGPRPSSKHSIDRIDNDGPYAPENCRWATRNEQGNNKRNNRRVTIGADEKTTTQWAELSGVPRRTISDRLDSGWEPQDAVYKTARRMPIDGEFVELDEWERSLREQP